MDFKSAIFNSECLDIGDGNHLHLINIKEVDNKLKEFIDKNIVSICEGDSGSDLPTIKQRLINRLTPKKGSTLEMGAIAEFFSHLYLGEMGFKQDFLFLNLEEGSVKKGFDGYYSHSNEEWIYESKSGNISTKNISHQSKIKESYDDLKGKISGNTKNDPWGNAYNHASIIDVKSADHVRKNLKRLSDDFTNKKYHDIKDFNIIPGSTIFLDGNWSDINPTEIKDQISKLVTEIQFKKINIICVNKLTINLFWEYLNGT